ncbi:glycosyltransferase [Novosphingopyxis iocasae]|uniref:glycosyltransferase n=1 Tax=Novosphingopyxis iocasae TaxID=2762729 RepID=UPI00165106EC|nr:glycosyltransferase [Novosphingopyxis iocasae]
MIEGLAWTLIALIAITFAGYPLAVLALSRFAPARPWHHAGTAPAHVPDIAVLICAYNEAAHLGAKLESVLAETARWPRKAAIWVADDGSSDATAAIAEGFGVHVLRLPRGGKAAALNALSARVEGDILVLSDADPLLAPGSLNALIAPFDDPRVGAVAGEVESAKGAGGGRFDRLYRAYESGLREAEDRLFGCVSADGGLLAIRRELMPHVPPDGTDDFHISTAAVAAGKRIAFARHAVAIEQPIAGGRKTMRRRVRITVRGLTALWRRRGLMNPARTGGYALGLFFHKFARRFAPVLVLPLALCAFALALTGSAFWTLASLAILAAAALGFIGWFAERRLPKILRVPYLLGLHLTGLIAGVALFCWGTRYAQWTPQKSLS